MQEACSFGSCFKSLSLLMCFDAKKWEHVGASLQLYVAFCSNFANFTLVSIIPGKKQLIYFPLIGKKKFSSEVGSWPYENSFSLPEENGK